jgi:hypothetical protein
MDHELKTIQKGLHNLAEKVIDGFERVLEMESPFPREHRELLYQLSRLSPGSGFEEVLTEDMLVEIVKSLKENGTL